MIKHNTAITKIDLGHLVVYEVPVDGFLFVKSEPEIWWTDSRLIMTRGPFRTLSSAMKDWLDQYDNWRALKAKNTFVVQQPVVLATIIEKKNLITVDFRKKVKIVDKI